MPDPDPKAATDAQRTLTMVRAIVNQWDLEMVSAFDALLQIAAIVRDDDGPGRS